MEILLRRSLQTIKELKQQSLRTKEPIAVIGMSCRFPGGCSSPEAFWEFLKNKGDGVRDVPAERWDIEDYYDPEPGTPGKMYLRQANFLQEDVGLFDARFFRISPLEAAEMDPQQRILLELSWEALERAGQNVEGLRGSDTGVFIGIIGSDYGRLPRDPSKVNPYRGTGSIPSIASGRIAHVLGFHGPALSVDTTCSSSLVSLQLACDSLRKGKSAMALAGGVNMMLSPNPMISLCMMNALSADGRCRPFDGDGQGYGRAEGAGLVVLKRLSTALADNDPILAVIRSTAVNQDGPSSGLTVPNGNAQRDLIREALRDADLSGDDITYLEAHGTGTSLGDPIEIKAVKEALGDGRAADNPLLVGSVKGNVGHLEGAAGICGLIKVILCLQHKQIPANANLTRLNPRLPLDQIPATVPSALTDWIPAAGKQRIAGVSSFGFSGTNAHVILSDAPEPSRPTAAALAPTSVSVLTLSAKTPWAFETLLRGYREHLQAHPNLSLHDLCYTANVCRAAFGHRAAVIAETIPELCDRLDSLLQNRKTKDIGTGTIGESSEPPMIAFLFTGGTALLGGDLIEAAPDLRKRLEDCDTLFRPHVDGSVLDLLRATDRQAFAAASERLRTAATFSAHYALSGFLQALGIQPAAVWAETREGLLAAGCAAGILSLDAAAELTRDPESATLDACRAPQCRFLDPATGHALKKSALLNAGTWRQRSLTAARPQAMVVPLQQQGYTTMLRLGPGDGEPIPDGNGVLDIGGSWESLTRTLAALFCAGVDIDWVPYFVGPGPLNKIPLPTYPFERKRYWGPLKPSPAMPGDGVAAVAPGSQEPSRHPFQGVDLTSPMSSGRREFGYDLSLGTLPEARDTHGIVHVGYYQEMLRRVVEEVFDTTTYTITEKTFISALILSEDQDTQVRLVLEPDDGNAHRFKVFSKPASGSWDLHVEGVLRPGEPVVAAAEFSDVRTAAQSRCSGHGSGRDFYEQLKRRGINLGAAVQWVEEIWFAPGEALARFKAPASAAQIASYQTGMHPGILDACAQIFHAALGPDTPEDMKFMVVKWRDFTYFRAPENNGLWCHVLLEDDGVPKGSIRGSFDLFDGAGHLIASAGQNEMKGLKGFTVRDLKKLRETAKAQPKGVNAAWRRKLDDATPDRKSDVLVAYLREAIADVLGLSAAEISPGDTLTDLGVDSMTGMVLQTAIERDLDVSVPLETIIEGPKLTTLAGQMAADLPGEPEGAASIVPAPVPAPAMPPASAPTRSSVANPDLWFVHSKRRQTARMRLFCLPYGGGGASIYAQWPDFLPSDVDVCAIQLPHRENRLREPAFTDVSALVDALFACIEPRLDLPFAFYGHSMGALVAYRLTGHLWRHWGHKAAHLFVGGFSAPLLQPNPLLGRTQARLRTLGLEALPSIEQVKTMTDEDLTAFGQAFSGFRRIPHEETELRNLLLPIFVGDLHIVASDHGQPETGFDIPITAFHGERDEDVAEAEMARWRDLTTGAFTLQVLTGDHLFLQKDQSQHLLTRLIAEQLEPAEPRLPEATPV